MSGLDPTSESRPLEVLAGIAPGREVTEDIEDCRAVRGAGGAGGPMELRGPEMLARGLAPAEGTRPLDGVPVLETEALEGPLSCLEGDFVGDLFRGQ